MLVCKILNSILLKMEVRQIKYNQIFDENIIIKKFKKFLTDKNIL